MADMTLEATTDGDETADEAAARAATVAGVTVRELSALPELAAAAALFDEIWGTDAGGSAMPRDLLRALATAENYVSGAFDAASGELLGACTGFFGPPSRAELHSHVTGVLAAGLGRSVGFALKLHQRAWCLRHGVRVIAWTYDPLIRRNAYFNLVKLGARPVRYLPNFYGAMDDAINGGTETDRVLVRWDLLSDVATAASAGRPSPASRAAERARGAVVVLSAGPGGRPSGPAEATGTGPRTLLVGVPADVESLRLSDPGAAAAWRTALREVLMPLVGAPSAAGRARVTGFDRGGWYVVAVEGEAR
jgi:predicted GNAT superfamily acetyltransferase